MLFYGIKLRYLNLSVFIWGCLILQNPYNINISFKNQIKSLE